MDGKTSVIAKKITSKYGKVELNTVYEIEGKFYKLTDGNLDSVNKKIEELIKKTL